MATSSSHPGAADRSRSRRRPAVLTAAAVALLSAAAAGCNSGDGSSASPATDGNDTPASAPATTSGTAAPTGPATGTPAPPSGTTAPPASSGSSGSSGGTSQQATARCTVTDLTMTLGRGDPGAGNVYYPLVFTNTTRHSCTLDGFPGVSLLRGDGSVIGKPATRQAVKAAAVRIAPGQTVEADLHTLNQGVRDGGCWRTPTLIMVYPPGSTQSMTLATANPVVCGDTFDVGPVH
ncbi:DUF4232 domain-containing protein [Streptomyces sp. NPDC020983]|uniref:DUF4232 domain-containing protein n=1 Tax=Streptomyces sp. NPDC020983 TaxID=3365106 RepID=UPI00378888FF